MRTDSLLDSVASGILTGGGLRGLMAGRTAILSASLTAGILCAVLQLSYNEVHVQRVKYVNKISQQPESSPSTARWISPRVLKWIGLTEYTDEEYIAKLKHQRDTHLDRIRQLEEQLEEERRK
ncbi:hypothetical protein CPB85DRAFT_301616 [Mucidula mucida]|nr:hypothetical protein CPB85DRAFT_301616 [Mucidula mucida]